MRQSNTSSDSDSVSGESSSLSASSNEHGHSCNTGLGITTHTEQLFSSEYGRNSLANRRKTDRNEMQIRLSRLGRVNIEQCEPCQTVLDYKDDFPPLSHCCSRSKVRNGDRKGNGDALGSERTRNVSSFTGDTSVSPRNNILFRRDASVSPNSKSPQELPTRFGGAEKQTYVKKPIKSQKAFPSAADSKYSNYGRPSTKVERLNICGLPAVKNNPNVKCDSLDSMERVQTFEVQETAGDRGSRVLRSGMVLLKSYISLHEQVEIVKACNQLGEGPGGFYRPGYEGGAKLHLYMMCLGQNWVPGTGYKLLHPIDNCAAPAIPQEFKLLVQRSIQDARTLIKDSEVDDVTQILPSMSPNICIANFYRDTGRLGLHQDQDESQSSRLKGLPVVSFSIGDFAVFRFGHERDPNKAEEVVLESGDVLLFGGRSRMIFHGVSSVIPNSTPAKLREEVGLLPGRLNLTFRQY